MASLHFTSTIDIYNGNPFVFVSKEQAKILHADWKRPMPVLVQINSQPKPAWRINMMPIDDGSFYLYLHGDVRKASHADVGDVAMIDVSFDTSYKRGPIHPMPHWFRDALDQNPIAEANWNALVPSRQKEILRYFSWLKSDAARKRNLLALA